MKKKIILISIAMMSVVISTYAKQAYLACGPGNIHMISYQTEDDLDAIIAALC